METIIQALSAYFSPKFKEKLKRCENIENLLSKLKQKQLSIEQELASELTNVRREALLTKLAVLKVQQEKAQQLLDATQKQAGDGAEPS